MNANHALMAMNASVNSQAQPHQSVQLVICNSLSAPLDTTAPVEWRLIVEQVTTALKVLHSKFHAHLESSAQQRMKAIHSILPMTVRLDTIAMAELTLQEDRHLQTQLSRRVDMDISARQDQATQNLAQSELIVTQQ